MQAAQTSTISIRVSMLEREKFKLLSNIENKSVSKVIKELVDKELKSKTLTAKEIRNLPKESRIALLKEMSEQSIQVYNLYKDELNVEEIMDGIE